MTHEPKITPLAINFNENWNHCKLGMDYSKPNWDDPRIRTDSQMAVERTLHQRFGDVGIGNPDPAPKPNIMAYGHRFFAALFGCEIVYFADQAPCALPLRGGYDLLRELEVPDLTNSAIIERAWTEAELLKREYGLCLGDINTGSPLNNAVTVFNELFLTALYEEPALAQHVLRVFMETQIAVYQKFQHEIDPEHYPLEAYNQGYGNGHAVMVSPEQYKEVILPVDKEYRARSNHFGLHHCGVFDRYAELYTELHPDSLDVGAGSDYAYMRSVFPDTPTSLIIDPAHVEGLDRDALDRHIAGMVEGAAPYGLITSLWTSDFSAGMTDENIRDLATVHMRI